MLWMGALDEPSSWSLTVVKQMAILRGWYGVTGCHKAEIMLDCSLFNVLVQDITK